MDTKSHKNKWGIRIRRISGNRSEDSLLDSKIIRSDDDHPVVFSINIIDSDDEFSTELSSDEENSGPQKQFRGYGYKKWDLFSTNWSKTSIAFRWLSTFVLTSK